MLITNEDMVGSLLPNVYISRIILQSTKNNTLLANVQLVLKEQFSNDSISSWLEDSDVLKYLKIFVIQSANEYATELISKSLENALFKDSFKDSQRFNSVMVEPLLSAGQLKNSNELIYSQISLFDQLTPSILELVRQGKAEKVDNSDGSQSYNIYLDINFEPKYLSNNPDHLTFLVGTTYDLASLVEEITDEQGIALGVSDVTFETVIDKGQVVSKSFVYVDEQDNVWPGQIHTVYDTMATREQRIIIRSGATETENSVTLRKVEINNYKIQDFRLLRRLLEMQSLNLNI